MATRVIMPKAGMAMETGTIIRWFKNVGDPVTAGEPLLEIQTDKVAMDVEAEVSGYLIAILRKPGDEVAVTEQIGFIGAKGEKPPTDSPAPSPASAPAQSSPGSAPAQATLAQAVPAPPTAQAPPAAAGQAHGYPCRAHARQRAGCGTGGRDANRPRRRDTASGRGSPRRRSSYRKCLTSGTQGCAAGGNRSDHFDGNRSGGRILRQDVARAVAEHPQPDATRTPLTGARKIITQRMVESHLTIPQFTLDTQADVTSLFAFRSRINAEAGLAITVNDFVMKATAAALVEAPYMLCSIDGQEIVQHNAVNLGMAVALETGLIVPVIRGADKLTLSVLAAQSAGIVTRARERKLTPDEMTGGTFTVSNLGMYGITSFTPLINPPEGAILGVNAARTEVYLDAGQPKERKLMTLSLSVDHRVIDGAQGALFLQKLVALLENPYRALI